MRTSLQSLIGGLLIATIGAAAAVPSMELVDPDALAAPHVSAPDSGPEHGSLHLGAFECEKEESEKANFAIGLEHDACDPAGPSARSPALALHQTCPHHAIDPIAAHAPRGPPLA